MVELLCAPLPDLHELEELEELEELDEDVVDLWRSLDGGCSG